MIYATHLNAAYDLKYWKKYNAIDEFLQKLT